MTTHAEVAAKLLRDAARLIRSLIDDNPDIADALEAKATVFDEVAELVESDPTGRVN